MKISLLISLLMLAVSIDAAVTTRVSKLRLGESEVKLNVYENTAASITFIAPHHNEQIGLRAVKEFIAANGGRLIEIESFDKTGKPSRYVAFTLNGKSYSIDPNRIFTENGRSCSLPTEIRDTVAAFAADIISQIGQDGSDRLLVAIHNNADVDTKSELSRPKDLTANAFIKLIGLSHGTFSDQAAGAFLSNLETDPDNFVFLSSPKFAGNFIESGFHVVLQQPSEKLRSSSCSIDDGSMSVYAAQNGIEYICLEADAVTGGPRQREMLSTLLRLRRKH